jgi:hypothetical protein
MMFLVEQSALKGVSYFEAGLARVRAEHHNSSVQLHPDPAFRGPRWN